MFRSTTLIAISRGIVVGVMFLSLALVGYVVSGELVYIGGLFGAVGAMIAAASFEIKI